MKKKTLTAIRRNKPSLPMRYLQTKSLIKGPALDFGSGYGYDAASYNMWAYDNNPGYYSDSIKDRQFKTITCIYVINTVFKKEGDNILSKIQNLLKEDGTAYIAVRRDIKGAKFGYQGSYQRRVYLELPLVTENSTFAVYKLNKYDILEM